MENIDLTVIYLTANRVPDYWYRYQTKVLERAIGMAHLIVVSREKTPFEWREHKRIIQNKPISTPNIFYQLLRGARLAKTPYVAVAEDDTLYTKEHFEYRNPDAFAYNGHRWCLYTWGEPIYHLKNYIRTNAVLIAPRDMLISCLEERFKRYPIDGVCPPECGGEPGTVERKLGLTPYKVVDYKSETPVVQFDHDHWTSGLVKSIEHHHQKNYGFIKAYEIPVWGKASQLVKNFK